MIVELDVVVDAALVDQIILSRSAPFGDRDVVADHVLQNEFAVSDNLRHGLAVDRRFGHGVKQEGLLVVGVLRRDVVENEEEHRDVRVLRVEDGEHSARDLACRRTLVGGGDIAGDIGVVRLRLFGVGVPGGVARHLADLERTVLPVGEARVTQPPLTSRIVPAVGRRKRRVVDQDAVVRDGRLMIVAVVILVVLNVGAGVAREDLAVKDLELSRVVVVVVRDGTLPDLHQDSRLIVAPTVAGDHLAHPAAVIKDQIHPFAATCRRLQTRRGADQVFGNRRGRGHVAGEVGVGTAVHPPAVIVFKLRAHRRVVEDVRGIERDVSVIDETAVGNVVVAAVESDAVRSVVAPRQFVRVDRACDLLHILFALVGEGPGRRLDQPHRVEFGNELGTDVERNPLRHHLRFQERFTDGDVFLVEPSGDHIPPAGVLVVDRDGKGKIVAQDHKPGTVSRNGVGARRRKTDGVGDRHPDLADLFLYAENDLLTVGRRHKVVAPVVDASRDIHREPVVAVGDVVVPRPAVGQGFESVFQRVDRVVTRDLVSGQFIVERQGLHIPEGVRVQDVKGVVGDHPVGRSADSLPEQSRSDHAPLVVEFLLHPLDRVGGKEDARVLPLRRMDRRHGVGAAEILPDGPASEIGRSEAVDLRLNGIYGGDILVVGDRLGLADFIAPGADPFPLAVAIRSRDRRDPPRARFDLVHVRIDRNDHGFRLLADGAFIEF